MKKYWILFKFNGQRASAKKDLLYCVTEKEKNEILKCAEKKSGILKINKNILFVNWENLLFFRITEAKAKEEYDY